ncbi:putative U3 small nucleolar RNA-associated protein [Zostera marina]|uniref:U3 small nucleolar RNA-associated protein 11 n=1 Tax=Zostera marina TaxID=29655 RepID=A0A0K9PBW8_ZOSMR|nr:putative U3 small nucleolar RNA-associated protein [Zostera marina]
MSSIRNAVSRRAHKERSQPNARRKFGILEKHKDYVVRAKAYHKKDETLRVLKEKAASRNPDEFHTKMMKKVHKERAALRDPDEFHSKMMKGVVDGVHRNEAQKNDYTPDEIMLINTQDISYVRYKIQTEKKEIERLSSTLHFLDNTPCNKHIYFADDRKEAKEILLKKSQMKKSSIIAEVPSKIKRKVASSYKQLEAHKVRAAELQNVYDEMCLQKELQKKGTKRKLREDELVNPTSKPVYKWRMERKR